MIGMRFSLGRWGAVVTMGCALLASSCGPGGQTDVPPTGSATPQPTGTAAASAGKPGDEEVTTLPTLRPSNVGVRMPGLDVCEKNEDGSLKNPIESGRYTGILRTARCDQQKFLVMARVAGSLGVECDHCHVPHPTEPKKFLYHKETDNKRKARWMEATFIRGMARLDNKAIRCKSCHANKEGKPIAKILKDPRDRQFAQIWMHEVMTANFTELDGQRLRCRTCHVGMAPDSNNWVKDVIAHVELTPKGLARK